MKLLDTDTLIFQPYVARKFDLIKRKIFWALILCPRGRKRQSGGNRLFKASCKSYLRLILTLKESLARKRGEKLIFHHHFADEEFNSRKEKVQAKENFYHEICC